MPSAPDTAARQHAFTASTTPQLPEPTHAERVRTLAAICSVAMLSTISRKHEGFPFGSLMPFALDTLGRPILLISNMAMHTQNLRAESRASLFMTQGAAGGDPLGAARATLLGPVKPVIAADIASVRELYLQRHESSRYWVDFADFHFFQMDVLDIYYVGGFGVMGWVDSAAYERASPDPLTASAAGILSHMNADHVESMVLMACVHSGIESSEAYMTSVDRLGFTLRLTTAEGVKAARINFLREVATPQETREVLVEMVHLAKAAKEGKSRL